MSAISNIQLFLGISKRTEQPMYRNGNELKDGETFDAEDLEIAKNVTVLFVDRVTAAEARRAALDALEGFDAFDFVLDPAGLILLGDKEKDSVFGVRCTKTRVITSPKSLLPQRKS